METEEGRKLWKLSHSTDNVKTPIRSRRFFHFKIINMGYTIPFSGHTENEIDFVYSTKFTFCYLYWFKWAYPIISAPNVVTFLPCNMETLLIFFSTPLEIFIVLHSNREQACLHTCNKLLPSAAYNQFHSIPIFLYLC